MLMLWNVQYTTCSLVWSVKYTACCSPLTRDIRLKTNIRKNIMHTKINDEEERVS